MKNPSNNQFHTILNEVFFMTREQPTLQKDIFSAPEYTQLGTKTHAIFS